VTPGGSNTQVQYNSSGSFAGSSNLTFDGTSLTLGGNPTLSGGTANGVTYLNGSKVLTSGSVLTFDGSILSVTGTNPVKSIYVSNATQYTTLNYDGISVSGAQDAYYIAPNGRAQIWYLGASEQMRLTSTGLGIGVSSPAAKLDIYQSSVRYVRAYPSSGLADLEVVTNNNSQPVFAVKGTGTADLIRAYAGATQALTLDSSGNLGLGVTPSAWSGITAFEQTAGAFSSFSTSQLFVSQNAYYASGWKYKNTSTASDYYQSAGSHIWRTAASGTAGNAISFTQAMTLDASGNLGVGTTTTTAARLTLASTTLPALTLPNIAEIATVSATAATGTINYDLTTQSVLYYTTNATGNFTMNIRGNSGLSLNSMLSTGQSVTMAFLCTNGSTAYYQSAMTIDGTSVTPKWQGGTAPSTGNASAIDSYVYTIIKTGSATFTVLASQTKFA